MDGYANIAERIKTVIEIMLTQSQSKHKFPLESLASKKEFSLSFHKKGAKGN